MTYIGHIDLGLGLVNGLLYFMGMDMHEKRRLLTSH